MTRQHQVQAGLLVGTLAAIMTSVGLAGAPGAVPGIYTAEQAARGEKIYKEQCVTCHREDLAGRRSDGGPPLRGAQFTTKWGRQTVHALFSTMEELMPATHPGSLTRDQYADAVSYILKVNGQAPGARPLPVDPEAQRKLKLLR